MKQLIKKWEQHSGAAIGTGFMLVGAVLYYKWSMVPDTFVIENVRQLAHGDFYYSDMFQYALRDSVADIGRMFAAVVLYTGLLEWVRWACMNKNVPEKFYFWGIQVHSMIIAFLSFILFAVVM